jgi:ferredoxin
VARGDSSAGSWVREALRRERDPTRLRDRESVDRSGRSHLGFLAGIANRGGKSMRVVVDFDLCESNALCMQAAPEVFEVRDDDFLYVLQENPPEALRAKVEEAVRRCPKQAITLED